MMSPQLTTRLQKTVQKTGWTDQNVRRIEDGEEVSQCGEAALDKWQNPERRPGCLVRAGVGLSLEEFLQIIESSGTGLSVENSCGRMLVELLREKWLRSRAKCIREWGLVNRNRLCDGDT